MRWSAHLPLRRRYHVFATAKFSSGMRLASYSIALVSWYYFKLSHSVNAAELSCIASMSASLRQSKSPGTQCSKNLVPKASNIVRRSPDEIIIMSRYLWQSSNDEIKWKLKAWQSSERSSSWPAIASGHAHLLLHRSIRSIGRVSLILIEVARYCRFKNGDNATIQWYYRAQSIMFRAWPGNGRPCRSPKSGRIFNIPKGLNWRSHFQASSLTTCCISLLFVPRCRRARCWKILIGTSVEIKLLSL